MKSIWKGFKDRMLGNMSKEELEVLGSLAADFVLAFVALALFIAIGAPLLRTLWRL